MNQSTAGKTRITIRLDNKIINWFKNRVEEKGTGNYQTLINQVLLQHIESIEGKDGEAEETIYKLEETLRQVLREERSVYSVDHAISTQRQPINPSLFPEPNPNNPFEGIIGIFDGGDGNTAENAEEILSSGLQIIQGPEKE